MKYWSSKHHLVQFITTADLENALTNPSALDSIAVCDSIRDADHIIVPSILLLSKTRLPNDWSVAASR